MNGHLGEFNLQNLAQDTHYALRENEQGCAIPKKIVFARHM